MAKLRPCETCGALTVGELADGEPICFRPCYQVRAMEDAIKAELRDKRIQRDSLRRIA